MEPFHQPGDLPAAPSIRGRRRPEELHPHRAVAEAVEVEGVKLPTQHSGEQGYVGQGRRLEGTGGAAVVIPPQVHEVVEGRWAATGSSTTAKALDTADWPRRTREGWRRFLVWQADTRSMNPTIDKDVIAATYAEDEAGAAAEYGAVELVTEAPGSERRQIEG